MFKQKLIIFITYFLLIVSPIMSKNIAVLGTGYVGLVLGSGLAYFDNKVICCDINKERINKLQEGKIPIFEPGLEELIKKEILLNRLKFTYDIPYAIQNSDIIFLAVGTPQSKHGEADLSFIYSAAQMIGENLNEYKIIAIKSTVPIGTNENIRKIIQKHSNNYNKFDIVSNPEFLKEGDAVNDFLRPNRVVIGASSKKAFTQMNEIYAPLIKSNIPFLYTDLPTAETIKYAANSFLAIKISYINEIAQLCEETGANIKKVSKGIGLDSRIGKQFLNPGPGFGGSCFPKDIAALLRTGDESNTNLSIVKAAMAANEKQKEFILEKIYKALDYKIKDKTITILGLAFKANTDDIRESIALYIIKNLIKEGAYIKAYDPIASKNMKRLIPAIEYANSSYKAINGSEAIIILTEWEEFKHLDLEKVKSLMKEPLIIDVRNIININSMKAFEFKFTNLGNAQIF